MFRFTVRDLLWLTLVIGVAIGWWMDNGRIQIEVDRWKRTNSAFEEQKRDWQDRINASLEEQHEEVAARP